MPSVEAASGALSLYIDWAINEKQWATVNSEAVEADINENSKHIMQMVTSLINPFQEKEKSAVKTSVLEVICLIIQLIVLLLQIIDINVQIFILFEPIDKFG